MKLMPCHSFHSSLGCVAQLVRILEGRGVRLQPYPNSSNEIWTWDNIISISSAAPASNQVWVDLASPSLCPGRLCVEEALFSFQESDLGISHTILLNLSWICGLDSRNYGWLERRGEGERDWFLENLLPHSPVGKKERYLHSVKRGFSSENPGAAMTSMGLIL